MRHTPNPSVLRWMINVDIPVSRPLNDAETLHVVLLATSRLFEEQPTEQFQVQKLVHPDSVAIILKLDRTTFPKINFETFGTPANRLVNRLFRIGVIEPFFGDGSPFVHAVFNSEKAGALESLSSLDSFELAHVAETVGDAELHARCSGIAAAGAHADTVIREAVTIVESRLRQIAGLSKDDIDGRTPLAAAAFRPHDGKLDYSDDTGIQTGVMQLFQGYFQAIANDPHHQIKEYDPRTVTHVLVMSDYLLGIIEASELRG